MADEHKSTAKSTAAAGNQVLDTFEGTAKSTAAAGNQALDTFEAVARVYLASAERLSALNLGAARDAVEDQAAMARTMLGMEPGEVPRNLAQPMIDKALAYSRNSYAILAETQSELSRLMVSQLAGTRALMPMDWNAAFELFRSGARQFSNLAAQNMTNAADTAAAAGAEMKKTA